MFYNGAIKSRILDPTFDRSNFQSEFKLDDKDTVYLSNLRLGNIGVISNDAQNSSYNKLVGAYGIIKRIALYDDSQTLSAVNDFNRFMGFVNKTDTNDKQMSVNSKLNQSNLGLILDGSDTATTEIELKPLQLGDTITNKASTTGLGWLSLHDVFDFLKQSPYLPTQVYKNLRVVIEYDTKKSSFTDTILQEYTTLPPVMLVDSLVESDTTNKIAVDYMKQTYQWNDIETDRVVIPGLSPDVIIRSTQQKVNFNINSFNNKVVDKLIVAVVPTVEATYKTGDFYFGNANMGSLSMLSQAQNLIVNGSQKFTQDIDTPSKRAALVLQSYPTYHLPLGNTFHDELSDLNIEGKVEVMNTTDYFCCKVETRISELVHTFSRVSQFDEMAAVGTQAQTRFNQPVNLHIMAEVRKQLVFLKDGTYRTMYV